MLKASVVECPSILDQYSINTPSTPWLTLDQHPSLQSVRSQLLFDRCISGNRQLGPLTSCLFFGFYSFFFYRFSAKKKQNNNNKKTDMQINTYKHYKIYNNYLTYKLHCITLEGLHTLFNLKLKTSC